MLARSSSALASGALTGLAVLTASALAGCQLITSLDESEISGSGGAGGGSTTASVSSSSTAAISSSSTGGPMCGAGIDSCNAPGDCDVPANQCVAATCEMGCCGTANVPDLEPTASGQTAKDCQARVCDGAGGEKLVDDAGDPPDALDACHVGACEAGSPKQDLAMPGTSCAFGGGKVCDATGACVECLVAGDCTDPSEPICSAQNQCIPATCTDGMTNGLETDKDCGGPACPKCADTLKCGMATDCLSGVCTGGVCQAPTCSDAAENGTETDVDCGGTCATGAEQKTCDVGEKCAVAADCATGACDGAHCIYKPTSSACTSDDECGPSGSELCVDGVCCDTSCTNGCMACSAVKKGGGGDGLCGNVAVGTDPNAACNDAGTASCGDTGQCAAGACQKYAAGTVCRVSAGNCDVAESCAGGGAACPADGFAPNSTVCRAAAAGGCDVAENCTGSTATCPADAFLPSTTVCRLSAGVCDLAENCTGSAASCPTDAFLPSTTVCKAAADVCDVAENCTGSAAACPADAFQPSTTVCRPQAGVCDVSESCTGSAAACPSNGFRPMGFAPTGLQTPGDCQKIVCTGTNATSVTSADDVIDLPTSNSACLVNPACDTSGGPATPAFDPAATGTSCAGEGGQVCGDTSNPLIAGTCVGCNTNVECTSPATCDTGGTFTCQ